MNWEVPATFPANGHYLVRVWGAGGGMAAPCCDYSGGNGFDGSRGTMQGGGGGFASAIFSVATHGRDLTVTIGEGGRTFGGIGTSCPAANRFSVGGSVQSGVCTTGSAYGGGGESLIWGHQGAVRLSTCYRGREERWRWRRKGGVGERETERESEKV